MDFDVGHLPHNKFPERGSVSRQSFLCFSLVNNNIARFGVEYIPLGNLYGRKAAFLQFGKYFTKQVDVIGLQCLDRARIKFSYLYGRHPC